ncbi:MAG TPA: SIMPL domain-containing protein [Candidatus Elarobacter sp.]|nr:SIMPL domain-containing protein [Candidatus Elarobacter sp.]
MPHRLAVALVALLTVMPAASFAQAAGSSPASEGTTAIITGQGMVSRAPDTATVTAAIQTNDDVAANATDKNNAALATLTRALGALHIDAVDIKTTYYNVTFVPRPPTPLPIPQGAIAQQIYPYQNQRYGYVVNRQLSITVARVGDVGAVIDAAVKAGVTNVNGVQYGLKDRKPAADAALALALEDAAGQVKVVAAASHMHVGGIKQIQVGQSYGGPVPSPMRMMTAAGVTSVSTEITPTSVDVRATATVTYFLKP